MFTKKTRALSALLTVCMLISMLACFVVPVSAEDTPYVPYVAGELYSATGLADVTGLGDIATDWDENVKAYKVTNRAGFDKINELVVGGNSLSGYTFTMANDIDFGWKKFTGVGYDGKPFSGTFDGNGFVVENLLIVMPYMARTGLFNVATSATFKNIGIASGLVMGNDATGSLLGAGNTITTVHNCWNAATVVSAGGDSGGLVGALAGNIGSPIYNSYNLAMVFTGGGGGLYGTAFKGSSYYMVSPKNSYNYGVLVAPSSYSAAQMALAAFGRSRLANDCLPNAANNAYVTNALGYTSSYEAVQAGNTAAAGYNDQAKEYAKADFTGTDILARLNTEMDASANPSGYTVKYDKVEGVGYPVLTYYKDGTAVVRRVAHTTENIGENTWATQHAIFKKYCENINIASGETMEIGTLEIKDNSDLFALGLIMAGNQKIANTTKLAGMGVTKISFTADIDASAAPVFLADKEGVNFGLPIGIGGIGGQAAVHNSANVPVEGNGHVIKNWHSYAASGTNSNANLDLVASLFSKVGSGFTVSDLGMEDVLVEYDVYVPQSTKYHSRYGVLVGKVGSNVAITLTNCWVTGKIRVYDVTGNTNYATSGFGGMVAWDTSGLGKGINCWVDIDVENADYPTYTKAAPWGYGGKAENMTKVYYAADADDVMIGNYVSAATKVEAASVGELAYQLNQLGLTDSAGAAVYHKINTNKTSVTWATKETATYKLTIQQKYDDADDANDVILAETDYYYNAGDTITVPSFEGYELVTNTVPADNKMPAADQTIVFTADAFDFDPAKAIQAEYDALTPAYFNEEYATALAAVQAAAKAVVDTEGNTAVLDPERYTLMATLNTKVADLEALEPQLLVNTTEVDKSNYQTIVPNYTEYETYKTMNSKNIWGVESKGDWVALTEAGTAAAAYNIYLKTDINMGETPVAPLCYGADFKGLLNGMGHKFTNIYVTDKDTEKNADVGFVGRINKGTVRELGIENGTVEVTDTVADSDKGFGIVVGYNSDGNHYKVWVGEGVTLKVTSTASKSNNDSYGTYAGRGNGTFDSCYSYAAIDTSANAEIKHHGVFADYQNVGNHPVRSFNSFGVLPASDETEERYITRYKTGGTHPKFMTVNTWGVNVLDITNYDTLNEENAGDVLDADDAAAGALAYNLNTNWEDFNSYKDKGNVLASEKGQISDYEQVYWTTVNGKAVYGDIDNQTRRVTVTANGEDLYFYGSKDEVLDLDALLGYDATYDFVTNDYGADWEEENTSIKLGAGDVALKVTSVVETAKKKALALFDGKELNTFADPDAITAAKEKLNTTYTDQSALNADVKDLTDLYVLDGTKGYPVSHNYNAEAFVIGPDLEFAGYILEADTTITKLYITSEADLELVEKNVDQYTAAHTLYLDTSLDLSASSFKTLKNLKASFDGQGNKISGYNRKDLNREAFFTEYLGKAVRNLEFTECEIAGQYSSLLMYLYNGEETLQLEDITINGNAYTAEANGFAYVLFTAGQTGDVAMKKITVTNNTVTSSGKDHVGYSTLGMLTVNVSTPITIAAENVVIAGNTVHAMTGGNISGASWVFGAAESNTTEGAELTLTNAHIYNNTATTNVTDDPEAAEPIYTTGASALPGLIVGELFSRTATIINTVTVNNVLAYNNDARSIYTRRKDNTFTAGTFSATNLVTDIDTVYDFDSEEFKDVTEYQTSGITTGASETAADLAALVYAYNAPAGVAKYAIKEGAVVAADDSNKAPIKVTIRKEGAEDALFFSDAVGALLDEDKIDELAECKFTDAAGTAVAAEAIKTTTADAVYTAYDHNYSEPAPNGDGTHTQTCGNADCSTPELQADCSDAEPETKEPSETVEGGVHHECVCGYTWITENVGKLHTLSSTAAAAGKIGENVTVDVKLTNTEDLDSLKVKVAFDATALTYVSGTLNGAVVTEDEGELTLTWTDPQITNNQLAQLKFVVADTATEKTAYEVTYTIVEAKRGTQDAVVSSEPCKTTVTVNPENALYGDVDGDFALTPKDATKMLQHFARGDENTLPAELTDMADVNRDGRFTMVDVLLVLQELAKGTGQGA